MKKLIFSALLFTALFSCKKDEYIITKNTNGHNSTKCESCPDIDISKIKHNGSYYYVDVYFDPTSAREEIVYPGLILKNDQDQILMDAEYRYLLPRGNTEYWISLPDSATDNCNWNIELVQLHNEDSVICERSFNQCLK